MAAGVAHAVGGRAVGHVLAVLDGQGVQIRPQPDQVVGAGAVGEDVADRARAGPQHLGVQSRAGQGVHHQLGGAVLLVADLGMGVEIAADGDQIAEQPVGLRPDQLEPRARGRLHLHRASFSLRHGPACRAHLATGRRAS